MAMMEKSPEELGTLISRSFQKSAVSDILKECQDLKEKNVRSWRFAMITDHLDENEICRMTIEWIFLEILLQGNAILEHFKDDQGQENKIYEAFLESCGRKLVSSGIFKSLCKYDKQLSESMDNYKNILLIGDPDKSDKSYHVILDRIIGDRNKWNQRYFLLFSEYYNNRFLVYKEIIEEIKGEYPVI